VQGVAQPARYAVGARIDFRESGHFVSACHNHKRAVWPFLDSRIKQVGYSPAVIVASNAIGPVNHIATAFTPTEPAYVTRLNLDTSQ
jgi:hypothetical protein